MTRKLLVVLFASIHLVGCMAPRPITMSCSTMRASAIAEPGQRMELGDFSVAAPKGEGWCLAPRNSNQIAFGTHPLMGQYIEKPEPSMGRNTVVLAAQKLRLRAAGFDSAADFQQFARDWITSGMGVNFSGPEPIVSDTTNPRFKMVRSEIAPDLSMKLDCVRYEYFGEERDNPKAPKTVLIQTNHGVICRHATAPHHLVLLSLSERHERGKQIDPDLFQRLEDRDAKPFFGSLEFSQAD